MSTAAEHLTASQRLYARYLAGGDICWNCTVGRHYDCTGRMQVRDSMPLAFKRCQCRAGSHPARRPC